MLHHIERKQGGLLEKPQNESLLTSEHWHPVLEVSETLESLKLLIIYFTPPYENLYHGQASSSNKLKNKSKKSKWSRDFSNYFGSQFVKKLNKTET